MVSRKATNNIKIYQVFSSIELDNVGTYLRDGPFSSDIGIVTIQPSKVVHWVVFINDKCFDRYGYSPPEKLSKFIMKQNEHCLFSENKIKCLTNKRDSYCASYCFYKIQLTKIIGIDLKTVVLSLYYQMIEQN